MKKIWIYVLFVFTFASAVEVLDYRMDECYWMDSAGGIIDDVRDTTANQHDGTSHGNAQIINMATAGNTSPCNGGRFDGVGDFIDTANTPALTTGNNFSIATWVYLNNTANSFEIVAHKTTNYVNGFTFYIYRSGATNYVMFLIGTTGSNRTLVYRTVNELQWFHVTATYDGTWMRLYINGVQVATRFRNGGILNANTPFVVGRGPGGSYAFNGDLDELKLYNHTLSAAEVLSIYTNENAGNNYDGTPRVCKTCDANATAGIWGLIGVPADFRTAVNKDVADVFDEFPAVDYNAPANPNGWVVFKRDYNAISNASTYSVVPYTGLPLEFGQGYWLISKTDQAWSENSLPNVDYNSTNPNCVTSPCVEIDLTSVNLNFGAPDNDTNDGSGENRNNMLGFAGQTPVDWADCRIVVDGVAYTPSASEVAGYTEKQVWQYNPGAGGANANGYTTCDDTTPGGCKLEPYKGFWLVLHGLTKNKTVKLLVPKE